MLNFRGSQGCKLKFEIHQPANWRSGRNSMNLCRVCHSKFNLRDTINLFVSGLFLGLPASGDLPVASRDKNGATLEVHSMVQSRIERICTAQTEQLLGFSDELVSASSPKFVPKFSTTINHSNVIQMSCSSYAETGTLLLYGSLLLCFSFLFVLVATFSRIRRPWRCLGDAPGGWEIYDFSIKLSEFKVYFLFFCLFFFFLVNTTKGIRTSLAEIGECILFITMIYAYGLHNINWFS